MLSKDEINDYGIVYTPINFVEKILDIIPNELYKNKIKCLDVGSGTGNFTKILFKKILENIDIKREKNEKDHEFKFRKSLIALKSITMIDINKKHIEILRNNFGNEANILEVDFLDWKNNLFLSNNKFDLIVGNPPYNINGKIKTPTNNNLKKKSDGITIYPKFIENAIDLLHDNGLLCFIIPIIWLKPDKYNLYNLLTNYKILKLNILNNFESNKIFNYNCQTPTCYFLIKKVVNNYNIDNYKIINIYDKFKKEYIEYKLYKNYPIPIHGIEIVNKLVKKVQEYGILKILKTNIPSKNVIISQVENNIYSFKNIKSCIKKSENNNFDNNFHNNFELVINYSDKPTIYYKIPKLIMAHKVYGIPFLDISGEYGISSRDNYIIKDYKINELEFLKYIFESKTIMFIFSTTRYRMQYLEKYCFEFIPNILEYCREKKINLNKIKNNIDKFLFNILELDDDEINIINYNYKL